MYTKDRMTYTRKEKKKRQRDDNLSQTNNIRIIYMVALEDVFNYPYFLSKEIR